MSVSISKRMSGIEKTQIRRINDMADASCINLGLGEMRFPTPPSILEHVRRHCRSWRLGYTPNEGFPKLRELIAATCGFPAAPEQVCVTAGAQEAVFAALMILIDAGDEVLLPNPGFPAYESITKMAGGTPLFYPFGGEKSYRPDFDALETLFSPRSKVLVLNSPHNPTGSILDSSDLQKVVALCENHDVTLLSDEVYAEIHFEKRAVSPAMFSDRCIVVSSLSKTFSMTGWRLGWSVTPLELVKSLAAFHQLSVTCAPAISQHAAIFALGGGAESERRAYLEELKRRRQVMMTSLDKYAGLAFRPPAGAFYIMADISGRMDKYGNSLETAKQFLAKEKVVTIPGSAFGTLGEGYLRLSFAAPAEEIEEGIRKLGGFLPSS